ncbi:hypothetical protein ACX0G9_26940 [Flavitalea flava]
MRAPICIGLSILLFVGCQSDRSKTGEHSTLPLCDHRFFVEVYTINGGGAFGGDRVSAYLTDSINFRKYLGTYINSNESIATVCKGDSLYIYRTITDESTQKPKIVNTTIYSAENLKKNREFE